MRIILMTDVAGLGEAGKVLEVADGYAANFLLPQGLALRATPHRLAARGDLIESQAREEEALKAARVALLEASSALPARLRLEAKAGPRGRLFGAVNRRVVATALEEATGLAVERGFVRLDIPIRTTGDHEAVLALPGLPEIRLGLEVVG